LKVLVTGAAGFIAGYLVEELLKHGHEVVGLDNLSKYGPLEKSYDRHPRYRSVTGDAKDAALNEDFNISTAESTTVLQLAEAIWKKLKPGTPFRFVSDTPFKYDVQRRVPEVSKARRVLGFECRTSLDTMLDEVIPWVKNQVELGNI